MIVKVQIAIAGHYQVLVYSQDESVLYQGPVTEEIEKLMNGKKKEFFHAHINDLDGTLILDKPASWQEW